MRGILVKSFLVGFLLVSSVTAQNSAFPVPDQQGIVERATSLLYYYPIIRDFSGAGARAKGMGGAFLGVSDDNSAVTWNPAGLYRADDQYSQPVVGLGYRSISSDATFRDRMYPNLPVFQAVNQNAFKSVDLMTLVVPVRIKGHSFVGSMAYSRLGDEYLNSAMGMNIMMPFDKVDTVTNFLRPFSYRYYTQYQSWVSAYNFGFGTRIYRNVSFGLAVNAYGGGAAGSVDEVVGWDSLSVSNGQRANVRVTNTVVDTTGYSGIYLTLGFKITAERFSGGLVIKTPHVLKESTDFLTSTQASANGFQMSGSLTSRHNDDVLIEIDQPMVLGLGAAYKLLENLTVACDLEYRPYSGGMINRRDSLQLVPGGTNVEYFTEIDPHWNNVVALRAGTEYVWNTGKILFPTIPLRAGLSYTGLPEPDVAVKTITVDGVRTDVPEYKKTSMMRWALGTGIHWTQIHLDFSYEMFSFDHKNAFLDQKSSVDNKAFDMTFTGFF